MKCIKLSKGMITKLNISCVIFLIPLVEMEWQTTPKIILMWFLFIFVSAVRARHIKNKDTALAEDYCKFAYPIRVSIEVAH